MRAGADAVMDIAADVGLPGDVAERRLGRLKVGVGGDALPVNRAGGAGLAKTR